MKRPVHLSKMEDLIPGRIYSIRCRNLSYGVWNGNGGFIGIRHKFDNRYLFTEYHWDYSTHCGTVGFAKDTGIDVPGDIPLKESLYLECLATKRPVERISGVVAIDEPIIYKYLDTSEEVHNINCYWKSNQQLFALLDSVWEERHIQDEIDEKAFFKAYWEEEKKKHIVELKIPDNIIQGED